MAPLLSKPRVACWSNTTVAMSKMSFSNPRDVFVADTTRFSQATGWKGRVSLSEGIDRTIEVILSEEGSSS